MLSRLVRLGPAEHHDDGTVTLPLLGLTALGWLVYGTRTAASVASGVRPRVLWPFAFAVALVLFVIMATRGLQC